MRDAQWLHPDSECLPCSAAGGERSTCRRTVKDKAGSIFPSGRPVRGHVLVQLNKKDRMILFPDEIQEHLIPNQFKFTFTQLHRYLPSVLGMLLDARVYFQKSEA